MNRQYFTSAAAFQAAVIENIAMYITDTPRLARPDDPVGREKALLLY